METWRDIPGYPRYQVSTCGRIRSVNYKNSKKIKVLKPSLSSDGYLKTMIQRGDGSYHTSRVHRWVAFAFLGVCPPGFEVNHIDGNKENNCPSNLEYCTHSENIKHAYKIGLEQPKKGSRNGSAKLTESDVVEIRKECAERKKSGRFWGRKEVAERYGITEAHLKDILSERRGLWSHV